MRLKTKKRALLPITSLAGKFANEPHIQAAAAHLRPALIYQEYLDHGGDNRARNGAMMEYAIEHSLIAAGVPAASIQRHIQLMYGKKGSEADRIVFGSKRATIIGCKTSGRERIGLDFGLALFVFSGGAWRGHRLFNTIEPVMYIVTRQEHNKLDPDPVGAIRKCIAMDQELNLGTPARLVSILDDVGMKRMFDDILAAI
jgi:hypothetical protein